MVSNDWLGVLLKNPKFKKEYNKQCSALETVFAVSRAIYDARRELNITQEELSERTGIAQGDISKLENGSANPSVKTLQRIAAALGKRVKIEFVK